ncbi:MAG: NAD(P)/FAD-dependent oxidoreductase [Helicobacteraceae bacterium]
MAKVVVLGSGFAGHIAALNLKRELGKDHEVVVVTPQEKFGYIPSYIWVGIGKMTKEQCQFELAPVYKKMGITYCLGKAVEIHPDSGEQNVVVELNKGGRESINYDYLVVATGPQLKFDATKGLGPDAGNSYSICTPTHAEAARDKYLELVEKMKQGQKQKIVIGTGHGMCTCQGAAFEYIHNIAFDLEERGLRDMAELVWISNEPEVGDFGINGMIVNMFGKTVTSKMFGEISFLERNIRWILKAHTKEVKPGSLDYITADGKEGSESFDFAMLIPLFGGVPIKWIGKNGEDLTGKVCAPNGFVKVDANYDAAATGFESWKASDWPEIYQNPLYSNVYAAGIAFAPPHPISRPDKAPDGTPITATPPRTGMAAGIIAHSVAKNIANIIKGSKKPMVKSSMAKFGTACVASMGASMLKGSAATMIIYPVAQDYEADKTGRYSNWTFVDRGLAGHWLKVILHYMFIYKMKALPGWWIIPD